MSFMHGQVCPGVGRSQAWISAYVGISVVRGLIFLSVFRVCPTFAVDVALFSVSRSLWQVRGFAQTQCLSPS